MAVIDTALTTVAFAKSTAGVPSGNTDDDDVFERLVNAVSVQVSNYCGRKFGKVPGLPFYTEQLSPPNRQLLQLREWPIVSVTSVVDNGFPVIEFTDFRCDLQEKQRGQLYRSNGWMGNAYVTGMTLDPVAMARLLTVMYVAGYYLPADTLYVAGADASLPLDLNDIVCEIIAHRYYKAKRKAYGLKNISEGGVSYGFSPELTMLDGTDEYSLRLNKYKRWL